MKATLESMDLEYEAHFRPPLFELPARSVEVLEVLHGAISPVTEPSSSDMQVLGGSRLSEVRIGMNLFGGQGWLNLTPDLLAMRFNRLQHRNHLEECKACIAASERALKAALPSAAPRTVTIKATLSLRLDGAGPSAGNHLANVAGDRPQMDLSGLGNATLQRAIALDIQDEEECWEAVCDAYRSKADKAAMTATCRVWHYEGATLQNLASRSAHLCRVLNALLQAIKITASNPFWDTPQTQPAAR